jgi:hypothetical protein
VRRTLTIVSLFAAGATLTVAPAHAAPAAPRAPVETSTSTVPMGSLATPALGALVLPGAGEGVQQPTGAPLTLSVRRPSTAQFSLVGATWADDPAVTDTVARIRTRSVSGTWGAWSDLEAGDRADDFGADAAPHARGGTEPVWTGASIGVEAEIVTRSGAPPRDVQLDLVDPGTSAADTVSASQAQPAAGAASPQVRSRRNWGADERLRSGQPRYARTLRAATLHHTVNVNNYSAAQVPAMLRAIYRFHAVSRGWGDIGYNVVVDRFGGLWEGRYGGLTKAVIGAHAAGFNTGTVGVAMLGNFDIARPTAPMVQAIETFLAWRLALAGLDPKATTTLTSAGLGGTSRYRAGAVVRVPTIFGHRDVGNTTCPGRYGYTLLPEIRNAVAQRLGR